MHASSQPAISDVARAYDTLDPMDPDVCAVRRAKPWRSPSLLQPHTSCTGSWSLHDDPPWRDGRPAYVTAYVEAEYLTTLVPYNTCITRCFSSNLPTANKAHDKISPQPRTAHMQSWDVIEPLLFVCRSRPGGQGGRS
ncbi:hypothetical protein Vretifemale_15295 [Volvox reticuliferus]|uniref:Uncharacterized protein n=1 Tax=Volvox reticuliferus TaxID=1737510 RepID=A0A8J4CRK9_9CHLO|nr:hypothetical protein Vretifemale_15295 [Volvox reticuliferus]